MAAKRVYQVWKGSNVKFTSFPLLRCNFSFLCHLGMLWVRGSLICFVLKALNFSGSFGCWNVKLELDFFFFSLEACFHLKVGCVLKVEMVLGWVMCYFWGTVQL